jgi:hypothetical protein
MKTKLRQTIVRFIHWAGAAARRLCGAFVAGSSAFILLFILVMFFDVHTLVLPQGAAGWIQFLFGTAVLFGGTLMAALVGLLWPAPFLALGEILSLFNVDIDF